MLGAIPVIAKALPDGKMLEGPPEPGADVAAAHLLLWHLVEASVPEGWDKTVLVTSPAGGDGKSTVACHLAISLARIGRRVLLVDANLRSPRQADLFGLKEHAGLSDLLSNSDRADSLVTETRVEGLGLLPAGRPVADPTALLNSRRLTDVLNELAEDYDHVVIDSPSVRQGVDSRIVAASCDVTLLVLRDGVSNRRMGVIARQALSSVGANVVGVVMNGAAQPARPAAPEYDADGGEAVSGGSARGGHGRRKPILPRTEDAGVPARRAS